MKKSYSLCLTVLLTVLLVFSSSGQVKNVNVDSPVNKIETQAVLKPDVDFGKIPLYFIGNQGQVNAQAKFYAKASRYTLWLTKQGLVFDSFKKAGSEKEHSSNPLLGGVAEGRGGSAPAKTERSVSRLLFIGANKNPEISAIETAKLKVNYFIGNDKNKWQGNVPTSMAVLYNSLYNNIDLKVYGIEKQIEYDWIVKPEGDPADIRFEYKNVKGTRIDEEGNLLIETDFGELMHKKPVSYQDGALNHPAPSGHPSAGGESCVGAQRAVPGKTQREYIDVTFKKLGKNTYGFSVGNYDKNRELIIDPLVLAYSTYLGGGDQDRGHVLAVDGNHVYLTGFTNSTDFPTENEYQLDQTGVDVFVSKLDITLSGTSQLIYSTYLGGGNIDEAYDIAVDNSGNAYITGRTYSSNFPTPNGYQGHQGNCDVFVSKLDTTQTGTPSLLYSTCLGGGENEEGHGIAIDGSNNVYVTGYTGSTNYPTRDSYQTDKAGYDVFLTKLDTTQTNDDSLLYSTYLGGDALDYAHDIAIDSSGNVYLTGRTDSTDFPISTTKYQTDQGSSDFFVTKMDTTQSEGSQLLYSTYLGGTKSDVAKSIAVDNSGCAYVTGEVWSTDFPTVNPYDDTLGGAYDSVVAKIDTTQSGTACLLYSTYLGGSGTDTGTGIAIDAGNCIYVTGNLGSSDFPLRDEYHDTRGGWWDAFVAKLDPAQSLDSTLIFSTLLVGSGNYDISECIVLDDSGNIYVGGHTDSTDFPIQDPCHPDPGDNHYDAFATKLTYTPPISITVTAPNGGESWQVGTSQDITWTSTGTVGDVKIEYSTDNGAGWTDVIASTANDGTHPWTIPAAVSSQCLVRVSETDGDPTDTSDAVFSIVPIPASITVTSPNGGESWQVGTSQDITWTSTGTVGDVKIEYSTDNGSSWTDVIASTSNDGTHPWTIPAAISAQCLVRVSETDGDPTDTSDAVFSIVPIPASNLLHEFAGGGADGRNPYGDLLQDGTTLYGMTYQGGDSDIGVLFKIQTDGSGHQLLHEFTGGADNGSYPYGSVIRDGSTLYGMTNFGGDSDKGTIYKIQTDGSGFTLLHEFTGAVGDGGIPYDSLILDGTTLYGTTVSGGPMNMGTVFKIETDGSGFTLLHGFAMTDGGLPACKLLREGTTLYGMTSAMGASSGGNIFKIETDGSGFQVMHSFAGGGTDGKSPFGSLIQSGTTLYGMTREGGDANVGTIFKIETDGSGFTLLHEFAGGADDGKTVNGSLLLDGTTLYGMTRMGGDSDCGVIFQIETDGSGFELLREFAGGVNDGHDPFGSLIKDGDRLYGMTNLGGDSNNGVIFYHQLPSTASITVTSPNGGESWQVGTSQDITWTSTGTVGDVKIEYSTDNGAGWTDVIASTTNDGAHPWTIPAVPSTQCLIRVSETDGDPTDTSDAVFSIYPAITLPTVTTTAASGITSNSASSGGNVTSDGGAAVTARGVCWSTSPDPTTADSKTSDGTGTGTYTSAITGLAPNTTYHVRAYAANSVGTSYGSDESFTTVTSISQTERNALIALYNSTNGDAWSDNSGWKTAPLAGDGFAMPGTEGSWKGITVSNDQVTQINLWGNNLAGALPPELGNISNLTNLYLPVNQLTGSIPAEIGNLSNLTSIVLYSNELSGSIPAELGNLVNLTGLHIDSNQFSGSIPPELGNLVNLTGINLRFNQLTGSIPTELGNLSNLTVLILASNQLTGSIPSQLGSLSNLTELHLNSNQLTGEIPVSLSSLSSLIDGGLHIRWNALYTNDPTLKTFLDTKQSGGDWESTQTIAPADISAVATGASTIRVSWTPIVYTGDTGGYRVFYSSTPGGPYTLFDTTADKTVSQMDVTGLNTGNTYYFVVQSRTDTHANNQNIVESENSAEASATTLAVLPTVTTTAVSGITSTSASSGGNVTADGGAAVTARGVCWSTSADPTTADSKTSDGTGTGTFSSAITGLTPNTTYHVRAYATNSAGTSYGSDESFTTPAALPTVTTSAASGITSTSASSGGDVTSDGGAAVTARGVCWSTSPDPTTADSKTSDGTGTGTYTSSITGLTPNTTYHVRAYATNSVGTSYGSDESFTTAASVSQTERNALIALYNSTNGDAWSDNSGWKTPPLAGDGFAMPGTEGSWFGVTVTTGQVTNIRLISNALSGTVPPEIGNFVNLTELFLGGNQMTGTIPLEIGNLTNLTSLGMNYNQFSGSIPSEVGNLTNLTLLSFAGNQLTGSIPVEFGNLTTLTQLYIQDNQLTGNFPAEFGNLSDMVFLYMYNNQLSGNFPTEIANMSALRILKINSNRLSGEVPTNITSLPNMDNNISDFRWNAWYTNDDAVREFLNQKQNGNNWESTQTIAPADVSAVATGASTIRVSWTPIAYTGDTGGYRVFYSATPGGPYTLFDTTTDKTVSQMDVTGLNAGNTYYFVVQTRTDPHGANTQNILDSENSAEASATTLAVLPTVTTTAASGITSNSASSGGNVTSDGGAAVTVRGVCWSTSADPTTADSKTTDGTGTGTFTSAITGLAPNTTYHVRAYATNSVGTAYGSDESFATSAALPTVTTTAVSGITSTSASSGGNVTADGGAAVTARGVCWSTSLNPTTADSKTTDGAGTGAFTSSITGLIPNTTYHVRAYATNSVGTSYGSDESFTTLTALPQAERDALIALYNSTNGDAWSDNSGWKTAPLHADGFAMPGTEGTWKGVIAASGNVTGIECTQNNLVGTIPTELGNLSNLSHLYLNKNQLSGTIPTELGNLTNLTEIYLSYNQLTGTIPTQLGNLANLDTLLLQNNQLTGTIPVESGNLTNLAWLYLQSNQLSGAIPPELGNITNLSFLNLSSNQLTGEIPGSLSSLSSLLDNELDIGWNALYTDNASLKTFLDSKQAGGDWESTQTIAPADVAAVATGASTIRVSWTPIVYTGDTGGYRVYYSATPGGPYTLFDTTADKTVSQMDVTGLNTGNTYYFVVQSRTDTHANNQNIVESENSAEASATTLAVLPTVTTTAASGITSTSASSGGNVTSDGGATVTVRGVCWSTSADPTTADSKTTDGTGTGTYTSSITGLAPNTTYHVRAYATNSVGTSYGSDESFTTPAALPTVTTSAASGITSNSASSGGNVTADGGAAVTARGVCWSTSANPTTADSKTSDGTGTGAFTSAITGLTPNTTYHVRAYATNSAGTSYGSDESFTTLTATSQAEREALIALYNSTNGDAWTDNSGWKTPPLHTDGFAMPGTEGSWYGITVVNDQVTNIQLFENNLVGTLPPDLGNLANLTNLSLSSNQLNGTIPVELGNLSNLSNLSLSSNQLTGTIPVGLGNLTNLTGLSLSDNQLEGTIPTELGSLTRLRMLWLSDNQLEGSIPPELGNLMFLFMLTLDSNQLTGEIPDTLLSLNFLIDNQSNIAWNALYTDNPTLKTFLDSKQVDGDWESTQTIAPKDVSAVATDASTIRVSWTPIAYTGDTGGYRVYYSSTPGGPYTLFDTTADKTASQMDVTGLNPGTTYYLVVQARTDDHYLNQNTVDSEYSAEVSATPVAYLPTVTTTEITDITSANAWSGGDVTFDGGTVVTERGVCWSTSADPTTADSTTSDGTGTGTFTSFINGLDPNTTYHVRAYATNIAGTSYGSDKSFMTEAESNITVTHPNGGERFHVGSSLTITWTSAGTVGDVKIEYSNNNGDSWKTVIASTPNNGSYTCTTPDSVSEQCLVRISETDGYPSDTSNAVFSITNEPTITVTSPNGGETWEVGSSREITWTSAGTVNEVKIEYSTDNGANWSIVNASTPNDGSHTCTIPNTVSDRCLVRVSETDGYPSDTSNAVFSIISEPTITVTSPNGGETWEVGSSRDITWTSAGTVGNVKIEYSTDNGGNWATVNSSTVNDGIHTCAIPDTVSDRCLVRVSETDGHPTDTSNDVFSIITGPTITVTSPNGGEEWVPGINSDITWTCPGITGNLQISLQKDGEPSRIIADDVDPASGSYNWNVGQYDFGTAVSGPGYKIKIMEEDSGNSDLSDDSFEILPVIRILYPNSSESWPLSSTRKITWICTGVTNDMKITLWKNGVKLGNIGVVSPEAPHRFSWTVGQHSSGTAPAGTGYTIKIVEIDKPTVADESEPFTIVN